MVLYLVSKVVVCMIFCRPEFAVHDAELPQVIIELRDLAFHLKACRHRILRSRMSVATLFLCVLSLGMSFLRLREC